MSWALRLALLPLLLLLLVVLGSISALLSQLNGEFLWQSLTDKEMHFAIGMSLVTSLLSTLLAILIATPSAWLMSQVRLPFARVIDTLLDLPMVLPPLVTGLGLLLLFNSQGILGRWVPLLSEVIFSPLGIIVAQTYVASAIMLRNARGAFSTLHPGFRQTAFNLGLTPLQTLLKIELPMCWKPLLCGAILAWSRAIGEFGATLMLAGATRFKTETLPMAVYLNISSGDFELAIGAALWLLLVGLLMLFAVRFIGNND
ncbi:ABC transporter permease subunit [Pasteurellaceae bacterium HPA106]|uniref:ABC transporter permease n=1 Tax=Spirabiliibacterium pneumoniae TaxID=221400 RepID=UPI001AACFB86|nr:ABC transporter permease [Spirabiliibacterium pneumoniae]MBE2895841.1 ABC transporter permease subunit [Spirabiliibacterium pneumoniae]